MEKSALVKKFNQDFDVVKKMKTANRHDYMMYYATLCLESINAILSKPLTQDERDIWKGILNAIKKMLSEKFAPVPLSSIEFCSCMVNSVFTITGNYNAGTCSLVDKVGNDYYFMTNRHVIGTSKDFVIANDDRTFVVKAKLSNVSKDYDIGLVKATIEKPTIALVPVIFAEYENLLIGIPTYIIGNNGGLGLSFLGGYLAAQKEERTFINMDTKHGSSGSPIFDSYGSVVGLNVGDLNEVPYGLNVEVVTNYLKSRGLKIRKQVEVKYK